MVLCEQGFQTRRTRRKPDPGGRNGYAYRIAEENAGSDTFFLHRHVDHPNEGGFRIGLRRRQPNATESRPAKEIYSCFHDADTNQWKLMFEFAMPLVEIEDWDFEPGRAWILRNKIFCNELLFVVQAILIDYCLN